MEGLQITVDAMDIVKALRELHTEKKRLDTAIAALEARLRNGNHSSAAKPVKGARGRKSMSAAERLEVSRRMTLYWEARRAQQLHPRGVPGEEQQASGNSAA